MITRSPRALRSAFSRFMLAPVAVALVSTACSSSSTTPPADDAGGTVDAPTCSGVGEDCNLNSTTDNGCCDGLSCTGPAGSSLGSCID